MKTTEWRVNKIEKPKAFNGLSDPMLCLLSDGRPCVASWNEKRGFWQDLETGDTFGDVIWWFDFVLPHGYKLSEIYYKEEGE